MIIEKPKKENFIEIDKLAKEIHEQHITYRSEVFKRVENPISQNDYNNFIDNNEIYVSKEDNIITGYSIIKINEKKANGYFDCKILLVEVLVIKKEYQGKGIGKQLMNYVIKLAKNENCTDIELTVSPENSNAIRFYEGLGMRTKNIKYTMKI